MLLYSGMTVIFPAPQLWDADTMTVGAELYTLLNANSY